MGENRKWSNWLRQGITRKGDIHLQQGDRPRIADEVVAVVHDEQLAHQIVMRWNMAEKDFRAQEAAYKLFLRAVADGPEDQVT